MDTWVIQTSGVSSAGRMPEGMSEDCCAYIAHCTKRFGSGHPVLYIERSTVTTGIILYCSKTHETWHDQQ